MALIKILKKLDSEYVHGYGPSQIPNKIDGEVEQLIDGILEMIDATKNLEDLSQTHGMVLLAYAERMASLAVRENRVDTLLKGMEALRIASSLVYEKELLLILALLYNSASKLGADWSELIDVLSGFEEKRFKTFCESFLTRSIADRSIQAMGYKEGKDEGGFRYVRTW